MPLQNTEAACFLAEAQLDEKVNFHKHPADAPLRDVDSPAIEKLREYIADQRRK